MIFDGVDEVPISHGDRTASWYPRALLLHGLSEAVATWSKAGNRILVTSRPYGLDEAEREKLGLPETRIEPLPEPQAGSATRLERRVITDYCVGRKL